MNVPLDPKDYSPTSTAHSARSRVTGNVRRARTEGTNMGGSEGEVKENAGEITACLLGKETIKLGG